MKQYLTINNTTFEVVKPKEQTLSSLECSFNHGYLDIFGAYDRPSTTKVNIWNYWVKTLREMGCYDYCITSNNTFQFTISGHLEYDGKEYFVKITPNHNYLYLVG